VAPVTVTDRTAPLVLGLEPRVYRELIARERVPHARVGRRVVARVEDVLVALDRLAAKGDDALANEAPATPQPRGVDRVLALVGRARA
jgi:hypothetical protein